MMTIVEKESCSSPYCVEVKVFICLIHFFFCTVRFYYDTSTNNNITYTTHKNNNNNNNSAAYKPPIEDEEYAIKVKALAQMLTKTKDELAQVKELADSLKGVKLATPSASSGGSLDSSSAAMQSALSAARAATEANGADSKEAALAWETVEEIAASVGDSEATRAPLDEECLIELIEGCEALEKFKTTLESLNSE